MLRILVHSIMDENNNYNVSLSNGKIYDADIYLQDVYLEKYRDSKLIENEKLERISIMQEDKAGSNAVAEFQTKYSDEEFNYSKLSIKVVYSDGSVFEREIYSE